MKILFRGWIITILLFAYFSAHAHRDSTLKSVNGPVFLGTAYSGVFIKHSPKLTTRTGQRVPGGEFSIDWATTGKYDWHHAHRFPSFGAAVIWLSPGQGAHRNIVGFFPHLTLSLFRYSSWEAFFRVGTGVAYAQNPHSSFDNPDENALGSYINNITQFRFGVQGTIKNKWILGGGFHLTHFSNGGYEQPNFGMNIPGFYASLGYKPAKASFLPKSQIISKKNVSRRWGAAFQSSAARIEYVSIDGPKYLLWAASGAATLMVHRFNRAYAGVEVEHNNGVEAWLFNNTLLGNSRAEAHRGARRLGVFVADEFLFGPLGIYLQASYHVGRAPLNTFVIANNYNKLAARYYFTIHQKSGLKTHLGVSLKAYKAVAESISLTTGLLF
jgi:hypothetical protein